MSQYPGQFRRPSAQALPTPTVRGDLAAPGLVPAPPDFGAAADLDRLLATFGAAGRTVAVAGHMAAAYRRNQEEEDRGLASRHYRERYAELAHEIAERRLLVPDGVKLGAHVDALIDADLEDPEGAFSDAYRAEYRDKLAPLLIRDFADQQAAIRAEAREERLSLIGEAMVEARSPSRAMMVLAAAKKEFPELTETDLLSKVALPAGRSAAEAGDEARFRVFEGVVGDRFPAEREALRSILDMRAEQNRRQREQEVEDAIFGTLNAAERGEAAFQQARDHVERERKAGRIDEKAANRLNNTIGERERTLANGAIRRTAQVEIARQRQQIIDEAVEVARGSVGGGLSMLDEEYTLTYEHGSGEVFTDELDRDRDIIPAVRDRLFAEIDRREDLSVAEKDARKVELLSRNVTMKWPEMERAFTGIALRFRPGATPAEGDDDFAVRAIEFWERMAPYPEIRSSHASGADLEVLRKVSDLRRDLPNIQPAEAFRQAVLRLRQMHSAGFVSPVPEAGSKELDRLVSQVGATGAANEPDIRAAIRSRIESEITMGNSPADAAALAVRTIGEDFTPMRIHGRTEMVYTRGRRIGKQTPIGPIAEIVTKVTAAANRDSLDVSDITIKPLAGSTTEWAITSRIGNRQIPGTPTLTDADLEILANQMNAAFLARTTEEAKKPSVFVTPKGGGPKPLRMPEVPARLSHLEPFIEAIWHAEQRKLFGVAEGENRPIPPVRPVEFGRGFTEDQATRPAPPIRRGESLSEWLERTRNPTQ